MRHTIDPKIDRLRSSWLDLDTADAVWLAGVADEIAAAAGTRIGHPRFVHIVLSGPNAGVTVDAGSSPLELRGPSSVLVLTVSDTRELEDRRATTTVPAPRPITQPAI